MPLCGLYDGGDSCDVRGERRYKDGWRCPRHTPARLAGRPEPPTPDPTRTATALLQREDWPPKRTREYGHATDTPRLMADGVTPMPPKETKSKGDRKR